MDSRMEMCFALENDPYVPPKVMSDRERALRDKTAECPAHYNKMWQEQRTWTNSRTAHWNRIKDRIVYPFYSL